MELKNIEKIKTDFLVIGTGIAGLYTAHHLSSLGAVTVLTKEQLEDSNTQYAQGGIAAVLGREDSLELHIQDTLEAGAGLCNRKAVEILVEEGPERVRELITLGTDFDHIEGELDLTQEGAHSERRILHARGDATGEEIRESLTSVVRNNDKITIKEESFMMDLLMEKNNPSRVSAALVWHNKLRQYKIYEASAIIMASGGCGHVYSSTSNPEVTTGDGVAAAYRAGAEIMDMEFIQFHPTTFYNPGRPPFLISETVRGEGGILKNSDKERFMPEYHELAELAPRDIVARAILKEIHEGSKPYVYLDVTDLKADYIRERFPTIYNRLVEEGIDMTEELIPVIPAAHYMM
ncbi:MAG: L-aspartate oxidase, partial [Bacillota bacterium]